MNQAQVKKIFEEKVCVSNNGRALDFKLLDWHYFYKANELYIEFRNISGQCYTTFFQKSELESFFNVVLDEDSETKKELTLF